MHLSRSLRPHLLLYLALLTPIALALTAALHPSPETRCGVVFVIMAVLWISEAVPLAVTALIPVFAFPLLGVLSTATVCGVYLKDSNVMFLGGLIMAVAVEHSGLHKRIALFVILRLGQSGRMLMAGFMLTTGFLSMWISNTAAAAMIVPIVDAVVQELAKVRSLREQQQRWRGEVKGEAEGEEEEGWRSHANTTSKANNHTDSNRNGTVNIELSLYPEIPKPEESKEELEEVGERESVGKEREDPEMKALRQMFFLSVAFAANIGGTGSPLGCGPNIVLMGLLQSTYSQPTGLNFATWLLYNIPGLVVCSVVGWVWLQVLYGHCRTHCQSLLRGRKTKEAAEEEEEEAAVRCVLEQQYYQLGALSRREYVVLLSFSAVVLLWLFRAPGFVTGWAQIFTRAFGDHISVRPATPVMLMVYFLFCIPSGRGRNKDGRMEGCLTWEVVSRRVPWGAVILLGGGLAMAKAADTSGLSAYLGRQLQVLQVLPKEVVALILTFLAASLTELASNTATASVLLPVVKDLAVALHINPLYLLIPTTTCCAFAFMLPVATPGNTIVLTAARMTTQEMMRAGVVMNVLCVLVVNCMINTLGVFLFDLNTYPSWINSTTTTI